MPFVPDTSTTLLRDVADAQHPRWTVFYGRYEPMMRAYLGARFPTLDADEIVQQTFADLAKILPDYVYDPKQAGHFHNYLTGILRHKALRLCRKASRDAALAAKMANEPQCAAEDPEDEACRQAIVEIALARFFADETVAPRTREVFLRVAVRGESPEAVAAAFQMARHAVDQVKVRSLEKVRRYVSELEGPCDD